MKGADTNLLVRYLVKDETRQAELVLDLLRNREVLYINSIVLSELYWVLTSVYRYTKFEFVRALDALLETEGFHFFDVNIVHEALADYIHSSAGFDDCLIHRVNRSMGLITWTFDKRAAALDGMILPDGGTGS